MRIKNIINNIMTVTCPQAFVEAIQRFNDSDDQNVKRGDWHQLFWEYFSVGMDLPNQGEGHRLDYVLDMATENEEVKEIRFEIP